MDNNNEIFKQKQYIEKIKKINDTKKLYFIMTMGCTLNENDSEKLAGMLEQMNYIKTEDIEKADLIVFNTCCIRENAEERLFGKLGETKKIKEKKNVIIAICGCMMQQEHIVQRIKKSYNFVDIIFGTHTMHKFPQDLYEVIQRRQKVNDILNIDGEIYEGIPIKRTSDKKALVTIMYGCNNFCTYCIVPYVRGRERSRNPKNILDEVKSLAKEGYKEITLLGQNVNSYLVTDKNKENYEIKNFADLLRAINNIDGIENINFVSPHPKDFTDDVISSIKECKKVSRLLHLPLQSGSSKILKSMNRKYTKEEYIKLAEKIKREIPDIVLSTDIIVGFPGETEEDFKDTLDVVNIVNFEQVFMFIYSKRVGTPAEKMENQVDDNIKHERFDRLKLLVDSKIEENNKKYIGKCFNILVEGPSKNNDKFLTGRTNTNKVVIFEGDESDIGNIKQVKIISEHMWYLKGEIVK